jgi:hypothetical protein
MREKKKLRRLSIRFRFFFFLLYFTTRKPIKKKIKKDI